MRLPAIAALTAAVLTMGASAYAQTSDNDRSPSTGSISAEELATQLTPGVVSPQFPVAQAPVRPARASAPAPVKRKLTLGSMPWLTGAYN